jgi:hypothetical protein
VVGFHRARVRARDDDDLVHAARPRQPFQGIVEEGGAGQGEQGLWGFQGEGAEGLGGGRGGGR